MEGTVRPCGCKGCRTCLLCETEYGIKRKDFYDEYKELKSYSFCPMCNKIYTGWNPNLIIDEHTRGLHANNSNNNSDGAAGIPFPGVFVQLNFINNDEAIQLLNGIDGLPWTDSQSGRRKQNYGPKTNFKKMKLSCGNFNGFPVYSKFLQERFNEQVTLLKDFQTIEQCTLEYDSNKGASIDPHIDDCWVWGERVVTVNCLNDSVLTLAKYNMNGDEKRYNLSIVKSYEMDLIPIDRKLNDDKLENIIVRIPMPQNSLMVLYGEPRYNWEHSVLREDIVNRRVCIAYREFTPIYLKEHYGMDGYATGQLILQKAKHFW